MDIRVLICDDIEEHRNILEGKLLKYNDCSQNKECNKISIKEITKVSNGNMALKESKDKNYEIIFLDIELNEQLDGIEICNSIQKNQSNTNIVFVTAHRDYACKAFEIFASNYIVKPIDDNHLKRVLNKIYKKLHEKEILLKNTNSFYMKIGGNIICINSAEIVFIEKYDRKLKIHMNNKKVYEPVMTLVEIEERMGNEFFIRCHKGFIVNINEMKAFSKNEIKLNNSDVILPVGRVYKKDIQEYIFNNI